jgi:hypothetical protein
MLTRSMLEVLAELSLDVQVPPQHATEGRTLAVPSQDVSLGAFRVSSGRDRPADAFTSVHYAENWFWIDNRDFASKRSLTFLMILLSLAETGSAAAVPGLTVSAGP